MATASLAFSHVSVSYGRTVALDDLSLTVASGEKVAITGANGAGKSTLLRCLLGLQRADAGVIEVDGVVAVGARAWTARTPMWPTSPSGRRRGASHSRWKSCSPRAAASTRRSPPHSTWVSTGCGSTPSPPCPVGSLQRCFIARGLGAVAMGARVLVADEPTSALDFDGQDQVAAMLAAVPATVLVVTHEQSVVDGCDRTVAMASGRLRDRGAA